ncbi:TadE family type IV pilus minor pilin [Streptomyces kanasensis]|uniref:TadE family type IV pilus minor pilin n=1 Tax=Streptomyces kanasensis TaxID=936756 RepID=UPI0036F5BF89
MTAEAALAMPALVVFTLTLLWGIVAGAAQIQCVDAARAGARAAARSEPEQSVLATARASAPQGADVVLQRDGELWRVRVEAPAPGPASWAMTLRAEAAALAEDTLAGPVTAAPTRSVPH